MGAYRTTFIGIYLEIPFLKGEVKVTTYKHPTTGNKMSSRFCPTTGAEGVATVRTDVHYVEPNGNIQDVDGLRENMFFTPAYTGGGKRISTFIYNGDEKVFGETIDELENFAFGEEGSQYMIECFKLKYSDYLEYFRKQYNDVEVYYGVVNYAH